MSDLPETDVIQDSADKISALDVKIVLEGQGKFPWLGENRFECLDLDLEEQHPSWLGCDLDHIIWLTRLPSIFPLYKARKKEQTIVSRG